VGRTAARLARLPANLTVLAPEEAVVLGLGRIVDLYYRSSTS
jgi:hypothetical protein